MLKILTVLGILIQHLTTVDTRFVSFNNSPTEAKNADFKQAFLSLVDNFNVQNTIVLMYDHELLAKDKELTIINELHQKGKVLVTIHLRGHRDNHQNAALKLLKEVTKSRLGMKSGLLSSIQKGYTFVAWLEHPEYLENRRLAPNPKKAGQSWSMFSQIIIVFPEIKRHFPIRSNSTNSSIDLTPEPKARGKAAKSALASNLTPTPTAAPNQTHNQSESQTGDDVEKEILQMDFWTTLDGVIGLRRRKRDGNLIEVLTVNPYAQYSKTSYKMGVWGRSKPAAKKPCKPQLLNVWSVSEKAWKEDIRVLGYDKFSTFNGASLSVGVLWKEPFLIWGNKMVPFLDGLDWRLLKLLERKLNFTSHLVNGDKIGNFENGTWTGLLRFLFDGTIDFALGGISITPSRLKYFAFSSSYYSDSYTFISPKVTGKINMIKIMAKPFQTLVWISLLFLATVALFTLYIVAHVEKFLVRSVRKKKLRKEDLWFTRLQNNLAFMVTVILQKPYRHTPKSYTIKYVYHGISITCYILGIIFVSSLISNILNPLPNISINRLRDVLRSRIPFDIRDYGGELNEHMKKRMPRLWGAANLVNWFESCQSIKRVGRGHRIYIDSRSRLAFFSSFEYNKTKVFDFHLSTENILQKANLAWPMRKMWPFRKAIDKTINRAVEFGLVDFWMRNFREGKFAWDGEKEAMRIREKTEFLFDFKLHYESEISKSRRQFENEKSHNQYRFHPITLRDIDGFRLVWAWGFWISIGIFIFESAIGVLKICAQSVEWAIQDMTTAMKVKTREKQKQKQGCPGLGRKNRPPSIFPLRERIMVKPSTNSITNRTSGMQSPGGQLQNNKDNNSTTTSSCDLAMTLEIRKMEMSTSPASRRLEPGNNTNQSNDDNNGNVPAEPEPEADCTRNVKLQHKVVNMEDQTTNSSTFSPEDSENWENLVRAHRGAKYRDHNNPDIKATDMLGGQSDSFAFYP